MTKSKIEWTDETWNPVTGCTKVSPGCDHCYAERITERFHGKGSFADVKLHEDRLAAPWQWRKPRNVFVNSMSDLFHEAVPDEFLYRVFGTMALADRHIFQILTKRHGRMRSLLNDPVFKEQVCWSVQVPPAEMPWPLRNVHLGVSVEDQKWAGIRVPALLETPAAVRFLSCEPLLGPLNLRTRDDTKRRAYADRGALGWVWEWTDGLDWVIVGGESGPGARPMHPGWARALRDQCLRAGVPYLFKQWGEWAPAEWKPPREAGEPDEAYKARAEALGATHGINALGHVVKLDHKPWSLERSPVTPGGWAGIHKVGKHKAGRELDGRLWDEYPTQEVAHAAG